jgi:hypothetical protein
LALRTALLQPSADFRTLPDLRNLESLAMSGGPASAQAAILAALFRANHAVETIGVAVDTKNPAQISSQREPLRNLASACKAMAEACRTLPEPLSKRIERSALLECRDTFNFLDSAISAAAMELESSSVQPN